MVLPTLIWTALPNGVGADGYALSISVSPRHEVPGTTLADYAPANWPSAVRDMALAKTFWLQIDDPESPLLPASIDTSRLRPELWSRLFPPTTAITSFVFKDNSDRPSHSNALAALEDCLDELGATVSNPEAAELAGDIARALPRFREALRRSQPPSCAVPLVEFYRALRFYDIPGPVGPPVFDFHRILALLGDHPFLMRALGLVIDCRLSFADLGAPLPALGRIRPRVQWGPPYPAPGDRTPWTRFRADSADFRAQCHACAASAIDLSTPDADGDLFTAARSVCRRSTRRYLLS